MKNKNKNLKPKYLIIISVIFVSFILLFYFSWVFVYKEKVYPGVYLGETSLSGKNEEEVKNFVYKKISDIENSGIIFVNEYNKEITKEKSELLDSADNYSFISFFPEKSIEQAFDSSANTNFFKFINHIFTLSKDKEIAAQIEINETGLNYFLNNSFPELIIEPKNAFFSIEKTLGNKEEVLVINKERIGKKINYRRVLNDLYNNLEKLDNNKIFIYTLSDYPSFYEQDLINLRPEAENILKNGNSLELIFNNKDNEKTSWKLKTEDIVSWLEIKTKDTRHEVSLNEDRVTTYLKNNLVPEINREVFLPKFEMKDSKVSSWELGKDGQELNIELSAKKINQSFTNNEDKVDLEIDTISADSLVSDNNFKIKEIIGTGHSNFAGSSYNRVHNIEVGADSLHGLLIKPDEEFSLVKALGSIDKESGYKTELVIKDGKTIPEYGGGLCQIGTTLFRTALKSGLEITMRRNHSYRVSYYEPAGTDATIYDPWPDFKFINDTGNYILIQARIEGRDIYFDFWGTDDGRKVEITDPVIYNIVKPPSTKYIETEDLAPGEKHCTEGSHNGANAYFDYKITHPASDTEEELIKEKRFKSYYVPWQGVCLIGKEVEAEEEKKETEGAEQGEVIKNGNENKNNKESDLNSTN